VPLSSPLTPDQIRAFNSRYHDAAAERYDTKWGIDFGPTGERQVLMKLAKALGRPPGRYGHSLEIGAGTGYFTLNLLRAGVIATATAVDISAGMLKRLDATARELGLEVDVVRADAERLPFEDGSFDLVLGHAVLHHLPHVDVALAEFKRLLAPGGTLAFMGEPSRRGDRLATVPKRLGMLAAPAWRRMLALEEVPPSLDAVGAGNGRSNGDYALEHCVDVHVFAPGELRTAAAEAGFTDVRVMGEELLSSAYGWMLRALEADADPDHIPRPWLQFAYRSYIALQWLDNKLLEPRLPASLFYNLLLSARRPT
jgi:ubiquinone/menaquinone biosynthesis C-methylase UbiE